MDYMFLKKLILILTVLMPLISCSDSPADLSEYRGVNYITASNLASGSWTSDDPVQGAFHYMGFNTDSAGAADGPSVVVFTGLPNNADSGDISRIEIFNLVPNGDFEAVPGAEWDTVGTASFAQENADNNRVHDDAGNNSLYFDIAAETDVIRYNLASLEDSFQANQNYIIRLLFTRSTTNDTAVFEYNDGANPPVSAPYTYWNPIVQTGWNADNSVYTSFPDDESLNTNITANAGARFCINSFATVVNTTKEGYIDDFRIVRSDQNYYIRLTVPYSEAGRPDLHSGTYRFSLYIKGEADADVSPAYQNRFRSSKISLGINNDITGFSASSYNNATWTKLSVDKFIQIENGDSIELKIAPADFTNLPNSLDTGSVLIASPLLYYISD